MTQAVEPPVQAGVRAPERTDHRSRKRRRHGQDAAAAAAEEGERRSRAASFRLARAELERQSAVTSHPARREQIALAIAEIDRRLAAV